MIGVAPVAYIYAYGGDSILHLDSSRIIKAVIVFIVLALIAGAILLVMKVLKEHAKKSLSFSSSLFHFVFFI